MSAQTTTDDTLEFLRKLEEAYPTHPHRPGFLGSHHITLGDSNELLINVWFRKPNAIRMSFRTFGLTPGEKLDDNILRYIDSVIGPLTK